MPAPLLDRTGELLERLHKLRSQLRWIRASLAPFDQEEDERKVLEPCLENLLADCHYETSLLEDLVNSVHKIIGQIAPPASDMSAHR